MSVRGQSSPQPSLAAPLVSLLVAAALLVALAPAARAADDGKPYYFTFYLQQSWPKQTATNAQIQQINQMFGANFDDWSDVANLNVGLQLFKRVSPHWKLGLQLDYSQGAIEGHTTVPTEAGDAQLSFEQRYSIYIDLYLVAHYLPCVSCTRVVPFVYLGGGVGYEKDRTTLTLGNQYFSQGLQVDNSGSFPTFSAGVGIDVPLSSTKPWYLELGVAYVWARMTNTVPATGELAPAPTVTADTDFTGPNVWIGFGTRF